MNKKTVITLLLALYLSSSIALSKENDANYYLYQANVALENHLDEVAIENFKTAMDLGKKDYSIYYGLGRSYYRLNNYKKAIKYLKKAQKINSTDNELNYLLGLSQANQAKFLYGDSIKNLKLAIKQYPTNSMYLYTLGMVYTLNNDYKLAENYFDLSLSYQNTSVNIYWISALVKNKNKNFNSAQFVLNDAIQKYPNEDYSYYLKSIISQNNNKELDAIDNYNTYLATNNDAQAYYNLALIYYEKGDYYKAIEKTQSSVDIQSTRDNLNLLGLLKLHLNQEGAGHYFRLAINNNNFFRNKIFDYDDKFYQKVVSKFKHELRTYDDFPSAEYNYASLCKYNGNYNEAIEYYKLALHANYDRKIEQQAYYNIARLSEITKQHREAIRYYKMALTNAPYSAKYELNNKIAKLLIQNHQYNEALRYFKKASTYIPHRTKKYELYYNEALVFIKLKRYNEALSNLKVLEKRRYNQTKVYYLMAMIYEKYGNIALANQYYKKSFGYRQHQHRSKKNNFIIEEQIRFDHHREFIDPIDELIIDNFEY